MSGVKISDLPASGGLSGGDLLETSSGGVSKSVTGAQILAAAAPGAGSLTNSQLANMANNTVKGRHTAGSGAPEDCTTAQLAAMFGTPDGTKFLADDGTLKTIVIPPQIFSRAVLTASYTTMVAQGGTAPVQILIANLPARSRIVSAWIRMTDWFNDSGNHGYNVNASITDGTVSYINQTVSSIGILKNSFDLAPAQNGLTDSAAAIPIYLVLDYGGNPNSSLVQGGVVVSITYQAPE